MIHLRQVQQQLLRGRFSWLFHSLIYLALSSMLFGGCGKLSDDTSRPSSPVGTSGGVPVNFGPKSTVGTYTLAVTASPDSIPADLTNFSVITATLSDASGRSVQGYTVKYTSSGNIGWFYDEESVDYPSDEESYTNADGEATVRFFGYESGRATVAAAIDLNGDGVADISDTVTITLTPSGPSSCAGSYCLDVGANPDTVPADMATFSTLYATVRDSSGGSVDGLEVRFSSELGYVHNDPTPPSVPSTSASAVTSTKGSVSIYYYGDRAGSAVITVRVKVPDLPQELVNTIRVHVTEGPGVPGDGVPGLFVDVVENAAQNLEADSKTGTSDAEPVLIEVDVWDATGDPVGPGVRVEFTGDVVGYAETDSTGTATLEVYPGTLYLGNYTYSFKVCTYSILPDQEQYCSSASFSVNVLPPDLEVEIKAVPSSVEFGQSGTILVTVKFLNAPVAGASVSCYAGGLISLSTGPVLTNSAGIAEFSFTGKTREGEDTVTAIVQVTIEGSFLTGDADASVSVTAPAAP